MKYKELQKFYKNGLIPGIRVLKFDDTFMKKRFINYLEQKIDFPEFNYLFFDKDNYSKDTLLDFYDSLPLMSDRKLIILELNGANDLAIADIMEINENFQVLFVILLSFQTQIKEINSIKKKYEIVNVDKFEKDELFKYINDFVQKESKNIDKKAIEEIIEITKYNQDKSISLDIVNNGLKNLITTYDYITINEVRKIYDIKNEEDVFSLISNILNMAFEDVLNTYENLVLKGHSPIELVTIFTKQFHNYSIVKLMSSKGYSNDDIGDTLGFKKSSAIYYIQKDLRNYSYSKLIIVLDLIIQKEVEYKQGLVKDMVLDFSLLLNNIHKKLRAY
jgi:DNA polymerase-3 subunit delta